MSGIKEALEGQGYISLKTRIIISIVIIALAILIFIIIFLFFQPQVCNSQECFTSAISNCNKVIWIREDSRAQWQYTVLGNFDKNSCNVNVKLLKINKGDIKIENLQGSEMNCRLNKGDTRYPEENIPQCSGILKEKLQDIIIQRMHSYLLKNLGEIKDSFDIY